MPDRSLLALLHLCDSLFPIGGFAHSDGLEAAAASHRVSSVADLSSWIEVVLDESLTRVDGPAVLTGWQAYRDQRWNDLAELDAEVHALRPSSTGRSASRAMGTRLVRTWSTIHPDAALDARLPSQVTLPVAFGVVAASAGIAGRAAIEGFMYTRLSATISAAMRLIPIGQREAHSLLAGALERVPAAADAVDSHLAAGAAAGAFAPAFDLATMEQQHVRSRLFLS